MFNRSNRLETKLLQQYTIAFDIFHLYEICFKKFKQNTSQIRKKYTNLLSYMSLMNKRSVQHEKQLKFIIQWKYLIQNNDKYNYQPHIQQLIKLQQIMNEKYQHIKNFIQFLNDISNKSWIRLQNALIYHLNQFQYKLNSILQNISGKKYLSSYHNTQIKYIVQNTHNQIKFNTLPTQDQQFSPSKHINKIQQQSINQPKISYLVSPIKLFIKQKPSAIKLLTKQQVNILRKQIIDRKKSTTITAQGSIKSDNATSFKIKSQNYNTHHTQINQDIQQGSSLQQGEIINNNLNSKLLTKNIIRHHRSNLQDTQKIKKMLECKQKNLKYNSIHKIQGINNQKNKYHQQIQSRFTIEDSSINKFINNDITSNLDITLKKTRINKISIIGKLQKTIKKIQVKNIKKSRGGVFIPHQKLKQINQIYNNINKQNIDQFSQSHSNHQSNSSHSQLDKKNPDKQIINHKRISQINQPASQKDNKYKRRFGVSSKRVNSNKSIDWYTIQAKKQSQNTKNNISRTSFFRSSGSNIDQKKSIAKSKYNAQSHKKMRLNKSQAQFYQQRDSKQYQQLVKKWALNRRQNPKMIPLENTLNIDPNAIVSGIEMTKVLGQIHEKQKQQRCSKYQEYYDEILRRRFEGGARPSQQYQQRPPSSFKIQHQKQQRNSLIRNKILQNESLLFDYMLSNIKFNQNIELQQIGIQNIIE